jgi:hypothetical protein
LNIVILYADGLTAPNKFKAANWNAGVSSALLNFPGFQIQRSKSSRVSGLPPVKVHLPAPVSDDLYLKSIDLHQLQIGC